MPQSQNTKALLIALGGSPQKAIFTINHYRPEYLLFFTTQKAEDLIKQVIQPAIQQMPKRWDCVVTPDAANFVECYKVLARQLTELLRNWQVQPGELVVDYTEGTQSMVMAMALAASEYCTRFVFASGEDLAPEAGKEEAAPALLESNPWDLKAGDEARQAAVHFNQGRYTQARLIFSRLQERVSGGSKPLYKALSDLADGYNLWDVFQYQKGLEKLKGAKRALELSAVWGGPPGIKAILAGVGENLVFVEKVMMAQRRVDRTLFLDLMGNAKRRAEIAHHYEDAMVRLYRALEALAQIQLENACGIKSQDIRPEQLPEGVREDYRQCFTSELDGKIKLPLNAAYHLLKALGDPLGQAFSNQWPQMKLVLDAQNHSILAHGFEPIKPERYQQMFDIVLKLGGASIEQLPRFPQMEV